jgi:hypothetical protein
MSSEKFDSLRHVVLVLSVLTFVNEILSLRTVTHASGAYETPALGERQKLRTTWFLRQLRRRTNVRPVALK